MKSVNLMLALALAAVVQLALPAGSRASVTINQYYPATVFLSSVSTNAAGNLAYKELSNRDLLKAAAAFTGRTNTAGLSVVYNATQESVQVVSGTNGFVLTTPLAFADSTCLATTNASQTQRFGAVYYGGNTTPTGTFVAAELTTPARGKRPATYAYANQLQFTVTGTNGTAIYVGTVSADTGGFGGH